MADIGRILGGLGAAVGGTVPQFRQQMMKEDEMARTRALQDEEMAEKRRATMFVDAKAANDMLQRGDLQGFKSIYQDRLDILGNMPNVDTSHTRRALGLADAALQGDRNALEALSRENQNTVRAGTSYGILKPASRNLTSVASGAALVDEATGEEIFRNVKPEAPTERRTAEDSRGILRYVDTGQPVFGGGAQPSRPSGLSPMIARPTTQTEPSADPYAGLSAFDAIVLRQEDEDRQRDIASEEETARLAREKAARDKAAFGFL